MPKTIIGMVNEHLHKNLTLPLVAINKEGKIILINEPAADIFKTTAKEAANKRLWDVIDDEEFNKLLFSVIKEQAHSVQDKLVFMHSSSIYKAKLIPIENKDKRIVAALTILEDYSNMYNLEKNIMQTLTEISHKLRTPLTSIKGFIDTLLESNLSDKKTMRNFLSIMHDETSRMNTLINNSLTLGSFAGAMHAEKKPVNITDIIKQAVLVMQPKINEKKVGVKVISPKNELYANINKDNFIQALTNLLDNSIKFSSTGRKKGKINIKVTNSNGAALIEIEDNGIGISPRDKNHIFERFYHVKNDPANKISGMGLGLSIAKQIIEEHDGTISCRSRLGKGSTFTVTLPVIS